ncbi:MAG TPA: ClpX C4-type zinc finger protein [Nitrososphaera sp.]|nr:ClpX C4-type zinc finger protein [Nitrososphaera sp.]
MEFESFSALDESVTKEDWERTPSSIRQLLRFMLEEFERRLAELEEDKILSNIEKEQSSGNQAEAKGVGLGAQKLLRCSFCGKSSEEVARVVIGPTVNICNERVDICNEILAELGVKG